MYRILSFLTLLLLLTASLFAAQSTKAMVATADPRATAVALQVLQNGGNAVDAAIAAQWVLNVVEPQSSGIGGGGFLLFYQAKEKKIYVLDGREQAPASAHPEMFWDEQGVPYPFYPDRITGGLPVGVPGTLKLLYEAHSRFGSNRYSFAELFIPAIDMAERGIEVSERLSRFIAEEKERLGLFESSKKVFLDENGQPPRPGDILFQADLAETFRSIQKYGISFFYEGALAQEIVNAVRSAPFHPGLMTQDDLFYYQVVPREAVRGTYRGYDIFSMGPPSSGGPALIEMLNILENFDLSLYGQSADGIHIIAEAQKIAFQDRNRYLGDPDYSAVPLEKLLSKEYAAELAQSIQFDHAIPTTYAATRPLTLEGTQTSHLSIVDEMGNMVSFTTTIESVFGSALVVPGRGFVLNNELTDFEAFPYGEAMLLHPNAAEGEKRPRSSMTPAFVFREGKPVLIAGSPGGSTIIATVLNIILNLFDFHLSLLDAVSAPRIVNRDGPVEFETRLFEDKELMRKLERKGHPLVHREVTGNAQVIFFDEASERIIGQSDPRGEGKAMGY